MLLDESGTRVGDDSGLPAERRVRRSAGVNRIAAPLRCRYGRHPHTSSTTPRNHRCAGSRSSRGCHICEMVMCSVGTGSSNERKAALALECSKYEAGMSATMSVEAAVESAVPKLGTTTATLRFNPAAASASSTGPLIRPRRDVTTWSQAAYRSAVISPSASSGWPCRTTAMKWFR